MIFEDPTASTRCTGAWVSVTAKISTNLTKSCKCDYFTALRDNKPLSISSSVQFIYFLINAEP